MLAYSRGQIARLADVNMETLRYYERLELLPQPQRSASGYRLYTEEVLGQLIFIRNAKSCGFTLKEIKKALEKSGTGEISLEDFIHVIDKKKDRIRSEIAEKEAVLYLLEDLRRNLQAEERHLGVQETLHILNLDS